MGIQVHSSREYRTAVHLIQSGVVGPIHTVYSWSEKKWGDPAPRPDRADSVPETLNWDRWLGVCADRPYLGGGYYHPGNWRKRLDFGTGTFGDMGCHILDPVCKALELTAPTSVRSLGNAPNDHNWANDVVVEFNFPATKHTAAEGVKLTWYDGDRRPSAEALAILGDKKAPGQGSLFVGAKGSLLLPHVAMPSLFPEAEFAKVALPQLPPVNHWHSFIDAIRGEVRLCGPAHRMGASGRSRHAIPAADAELGRGRPESDERPACQRLRPPGLSGRLGGRGVELTEAETGISIEALDGVIRGAVGCPLSQLTGHRGSSSCRRPRAICPIASIRMN
jgi:predicted dehydrogenase